MNYHNNKDDNTKRNTHVNNIDMNNNTHNNKIKNIVMNNSNNNNTHNNNYNMYNNNDKYDNNTHHNVTPAVKYTPMKTNVKYDNMNKIKT